MNIYKVTLIIGDIVIDELDIEAANETMAEDILNNDLANHKPFDRYFIRQAETAAKAE